MGTKQQCSQHRLHLRYNLAVPKDEILSWCCENRRTTRARARVSSVYSTCDAGYDVGKADEREGFDVGKADAPACTSSTQFQVGKNVRKNS